MKRLTAFFTTAILVCIATFVVFASNQNRDTSSSTLTVQPVTVHEQLTAGDISDIDNVASDSEGPLTSSGHAWAGYFINEDGEFWFGAGGYGYVSCYTDNERYRTTYTLYAKVPEGVTYANERNPQTLPREGSFYDYVSVDGDGNGSHYKLPGSSSASASASGTNPSNGDQHNTSAATPTTITARDLYIDCEVCDNYGCSLCDEHR